MPTFYPQEPVAAFFGHARSEIAFRASPSHTDDTSSDNRGLRIRRTLRFLQGKGSNRYRRRNRGRPYRRHSRIDAHTLRARSSGKARQTVQRIPSCCDARCFRFWKLIPLTTVE